MTNLNEDFVTALSRYVTDDLEPGEERYRLYRLCECAACDGFGKERIRMNDLPNSNYPDGYLYGSTGERCPDCRGEGRTRELVATATDPESLGVALVTLGREGEWKDCPIGILDTQGATGEKWLVRPWLPSARNTSQAGRVLQSAQRKGKT
jgi:hypothetical protein